MWSCTTTAITLLVVVLLIIMIFKDHIETQNNIFELVINLSLEVKI
ncbi:hypothetical protein ACTFIY_010689 [Dictyostelium cf. discoideum]